MINEHCKGVPVVCVETFDIKYRGDTNGNMFTVNRGDIWYKKRQKALFNTEVRLENELRWIELPKDEYQRFFRKLVKV